MGPPLAASRPAVPAGPSADEWRAMSADAREELLLRVLDALSEPAEAMGEGRPHKHAKTRALDLLGLHFRTLGRAVYVQEEMAVLYPGEPAFSPDVLAVLDVEQPAIDERLAWVVTEEQKGVDFVLEVLHQGDRKKDLVDNVQRYARLSIPEYFVYDRARQQIVGHRLGADRRYERIVPQGGRTPSQVLGLDLAVQRGTLRVFHGAAELYDSTALIARLSDLVGDLEAKADLAEAQASLSDEARAQAEARASGAEARIGDALAVLRSGVLETLRAKGSPVSETLRARVTSCNDVALLGRWLTRALALESGGETAEAALAEP